MIQNMSGAMKKVQKPVCRLIAGELTGLYVRSGSQYCEDDQGKHVETHLDGMNLHARATDV
jgi:hypothetical protein